MHVRRLVCRGPVYPALVLIAVGVAAVAPAQNLVTVRAPSVNEVLSDAATVARAAGKEMDPQAILAKAFASAGLEQTGLLALDRPVAVVLPLAGMPMQQKGVVAAVPVTDTTAAIDALAARFASHTVEEGLHTFGTDQGPVLYALAADGYLRIGGDSSLVKTVDPLAGKGPDSGILVDVFIEPMLPMIQGGLQAAKQKVETKLQASPEVEEAPYDPATMGKMMDLYLDGLDSLLANTSRLQVALDVDAGFVRLGESLVAKEGGPLASFIAAQKGGLPAVAAVVDQNAAVYTAGRVTLTDELRGKLGSFFDSYMKLVSAMVASAPEKPAAGTADAGAETPPASGLWAEYMAFMTPWGQRWLSCWNGDLAASFDLGEKGRMQLSEAIGLKPEEGCRGLVREMAAELGKRLAKEGSQLATVLATSNGPAVGGGPSLLVSFDMMKLLEATGQPEEKGAEEALKTLYGERMTVATATQGDAALVTAGQDAGARLQSLAAELEAPGHAPSFAPLGGGPGLYVGLNLGRLLRGAASASPEKTEELTEAAAALSGEAGRIPMALRFRENALSFESAVPLKTVAAVARIAKEKQAEAQHEAEQEAEPEPAAKLE